MRDTLFIAQLERRFQAMRSLKYIPKEGWIKTIRKLYQMSAQQLARIADVPRVNVTYYEKAEVDRSISLANLYKIADALNCDVHYALVPRVPVEVFIEQQAKKQVKEMILSLAKTMALEDQAVSNEELDRLYKETMKELLENPKLIWEK